MENKNRIFSRSGSLLSNSALIRFVTGSGQAHVPVLTDRSILVTELALIHTSRDCKLSAFVALHIPYCVTYPKSHLVVVWVYS